MLSEHLIELLPGGLRPDRRKAAELMMAAVGRTATLDALDGPGLPLLRQRISD